MARRPNPLPAAIWNLYFPQIHAPSNLYVRRADSAPRNREVPMLDLMFIAIGLTFLAGAMLYAFACERM
jgi:hypothetical protein